MLGPNRADLFVGGEITAIGSGLGPGDGLALLGRQWDRSGIGAGKLKDNAGNIVLHIRGEFAHSLNSSIEQLRHGTNIPGFDRIMKLLRTCPLAETT